jgi:hypothetical protein
MQAVGAGQVEHAHGLARSQRQPAFLALDGDAGVIGNLLVAAGQAVEQRRLAGIGIADERRQAPRRMQVDDGLVHAERMLRSTSSWRS